MKRTARGHARGKQVTAVVGLAAAGWALGMVPGSLGRAQAATAMETCRSTLSGKAPSGPVVAKAAPGAAMAVNVVWEPKDWSGNRLAEIVTCVAVADQLASDLTTLNIGPPNTGSFIRTLTMPFEAPGTLVCQQSLLIGTGSEGVSGIRRTNPVCFEAVEASASAPAPTPVPTPARAAPTPPPAPDPAPAPAPALTPAKAMPSPASPPSRTADQATGAGTVEAAPAPAEKPRAAAPLARTGSDHRVPLATAGALFLLGGGAVAVGWPASRRRPRVRPSR